MARPTRQNQASDYLLAVRFTGDEKELLKKLVEAQNAELRQQGVAAVVTASSLIRTLILQKAMQLNLVAKDDGAKVKTSKSKAAKSRHRRAVEGGHMAHVDDAKAVGKPKGRKK